MRAWPPIWVPGGRGLSDAFGADGVLESVSVRRLEDRLSLRMRYKGREHMACLPWDPPPSPRDVEQALRTPIGNTIRDIGELDVQRATGYRGGAPSRWNECSGSV